MFPTQFRFYADMLDYSVHPLLYMAIELLANA